STCELSPALTQLDQDTRRRSSSSVPTRSSAPSASTKCEPPEPLIELCTVTEPANGLVPLFHSRPFFIVGVWPEAAATTPPSRQVLLKNVQLIVVLLAPEGPASHSAAPAPFAQLLLKMQFTNIVFAHQLR